MPSSNGPHICPAASDWNLIHTRVRETHERLERMEEHFMEAAQNFSNISNAVTDIRNQILASALGRNHIDADTHRAIVKSQSRTYGTIIFVLLAVLGFLLIGEKFEFIRMLH